MIMMMWLVLLLLAIEQAHEDSLSKTCVYVPGLA